MHVPAENPLKDASRSLELLWSTADRRVRGGGPRPGLSIPKIVEAGIRVVNSDGLEALSMQRVASELNYTTMSLYRYVPGKTQLLDLMVDTACGAPSNTPVAGGWRAEVEQWVSELWDVYLRHPWMLQVQIRHPPIGPNQLAWFESLLRSMWRVGIGHGDLIAVAMFLTCAVRDLARLSTELMPMAVGYTEVLGIILEHDQYPTIAELVREQSAAYTDAEGDGGPDDDSDGNGGDVRPAVEFGVQRLLDGIESHVRSLRRKRR